MSSQQQQSLATDATRDLPAVLNVSQRAPFVLGITTMLGTMHYQYKFKVSADAGAGAGCVEIRKLPGGRPVRNEFRLLRISPSVYILVCSKLYNCASVRPPISFPIEYRRRSRSWVATSSYNNIRSVLSLNCHEDGFGLLASICTTEVTVHFPPDGTMSITCFGPLGYVLNQARPDDRDLPESGDGEEDTVASASASTRPGAEVATPTPTPTHGGANSTGVVNVPSIIADSLERKLSSSVTEATAVTAQPFLAKPSSFL